MKWHCSECGEAVGDNDMVGYFTDGNNKYVPGTLGFWHCNPKCGRRDLDFAGVMHPKDFHIASFKERMPQILAEFIYIMNTEEFRRDYAAFLLKCLADGYDEAYPHINDAKYAGIIESNLPGDMLWHNEIQAVLAWKQKGA